MGYYSKLAALEQMSASERAEAERVHGIVEAARQARTDEPALDLGETRRTRTAQEEGR